MVNSIRNRLAISFIGLALGPVLLVGSFLIFKTYSIQTRNAVNLQREMAAHLASRVESLINDLETDLRLLVRLEDLLNYNKKKRRKILSIFFSKQSAIEDLVLIDDRGRILGFLSRLKLYEHWTPYLQEGVNAFIGSSFRDKTFFGPVHFQEESGEPLMVMAIPVLALDSGKLRGVLIADIRLKEIWHLVAEIRPGKEGMSYIVDIRNRIIAHSNPSIVLRGTSFDLQVKDGILTGLNGKKSVLVSQQIRLGKQQFNILVEDPVSEALALAIQTVQIMLIIIIISLVVAIVIGLFTVRRIVGPVEEIAETARAINAGDLSRQVVVNRDDELGVLANAFNNMTMELRGLINDLEQRVAERTKELAASNKELEAFAYSVSHDLRSPLRHIDGFIDLLKKRIEKNLDDKGLHYMMSITVAAKKMGELIDSLLAFSRMGRQSMLFKQTDLGEIVNDVINELGQDLADRKINWDIADLPVVSGDPSMLRIVMMNLISNALKFTRTREQTHITIGWQDKDQYILVFIRDNGVGFDPAYIDKLFLVFQRLHHADEFEGTGIGLAMVQRIIQRHGGTIRAEGEPDKGAVFNFLLPKRKGGTRNEKTKQNTSG